MAIETLRWKKDSLVIIDQTLLPENLVYLKLKTIEEVWEAIKKLRVRGAPAIGVAAAFGLYLGMKKSKAKNFIQFQEDLEISAKYLSASRPTAVNLFWALQRIKDLCYNNHEKHVSEIKKLILDEALKMQNEDDEICKKIGDVGSEFLKDGDTVLTHCNAGGLATVTYGTALSVVYRAVENGKTISVYADETRPLLQGARLTAWELSQNDIPVTVICDNMAAKVMNMGLINAVIVGADRIAANGDFANKIGTYSLAIAAQYHNIPLYCAAPLSTFDISIINGKEIPIEEREPSEIKIFNEKKITPDNVEVYNPAFDVTLANLVSAFFTEAGAILPPFKKNIKKAFSGK